MTAQHLHQTSSPVACGATSPFGGVCMQAKGHDSPHVAWQPGLRMEWEAHPAGTLRRRLERAEEEIAYLREDLAAAGGTR